MLKNQLAIINQQLSQIVDMLVLNGTLTECPGLIHGKIGLSIFFFHYARYTENMLFSDYAVDLIGEVQSQIHVNTSADYEKGIAGIGVGIDYLIQNNFLVAENDICEDLDQRMLRAVLYDPWQDFSLYSGLIGYGWYWISRLRYESSSILARKCLLYIVETIIERLPDILIEERTDVYCFLHALQRVSGFEHWMELFKKKQEWDWSIEIGCSSRLGKSIVGSVALTFQRNWYSKGMLQINVDNLMEQFCDLDMKMASINMGLLSGYAGEGLLRLSIINEMNMSWLLLL